MSFTSGGRTDSCTVCSPSVSTTTQVARDELTLMISPSSTTCPETLEWTGALMKAVLSPISWPTFTESPFLTRGWQGAPMCCCIEM